MALGLKPGEIAALVRVADLIKANSGVQFAFFDTQTEEGTKELARYNSAISKLRAKHRRIEKMRKEKGKRDGGKIRAFKHEGNAQVPDGVE